MARASKKHMLIEFKGTTLPIVSVTLHSLHPEQLSTTADELFGDEAFFDGDAAVLELDRIETTEGGTPDWLRIRTLFLQHGLHIIGVRGGNDILQTSAEAAGLPVIAALKRAPRTTEAAPQTATEAAPPPPAEAPAQPFTPALIIDRPLRSGQQAYARNGDLVVLAAVNAGAEVIADGSIHIYAPLRGRALAGASGDTGARIFTTRFEAELVSIAGVYRTFESGIPEPLSGRPVQVRLDANQLNLMALKTD